MAANVIKKHGYLAGTAQERVDDLHRMFLDNEVKAIMAIHGGSGSAQMLPLLDYKLIANNPKILVLVIVILPHYLLVFMKKPDWLLSMVRWLFQLLPTLPKSIFSKRLPHPIRLALLLMLHTMIICKLVIGYGHNDQEMQKGN